MISDMIDLVPSEYITLWRPLVESAIFRLQNLEFFDETPVQDFRIQLALAACLLFLLVLCFCMLYRGCGRKIHNPKSHAALIQALSTVMIPTRSIWPSTYTLIAKKPSSLRSRTIDIPLFGFLQHIYHGEIELRDPNDLPDLFRSDLRVYGLLIRFELESIWLSIIIRWLMKYQIFQFTSFALDSPSYRSDEKDTLFDDDTNFVPSHLTTSPSHSSSVLSLDYLPYSQIEASLELFRTNLHDGASGTLEFTTLAPNISFLSTPFILSSIPFLPRKYLERNKQTPPLRITQRTSTPLFASLPRIIELLTSTSQAGSSISSSPIRIDSIQNVSQHTSSFLQTLSTSLLDDTQVRTKFVDNWSIEGWREHRFLLDWEAGLLDAGLLTKWVVVIRK